MADRNTRPPFKMTFFTADRAFHGLLPGINPLLHNEVTAPVLLPRQTQSYLIIIKADVFFIPPRFIKSDRSWTVVSPGLIVHKVLAVN